MRIVGGRFRGLGLAALGKGDPAAHLRPTSDRVRESLFNLLTNGAMGEVVEGAEVLDLFAGTGALGLEALSRGAAFVTFVENGRAGGRLIAENVAKARVADEVRHLRCDATRLPEAERPASLIFLDPPYGKGLGSRALGAARARGWIAPEAVVVWEENAPQSPPEGFRALDERRYGDTVITLLQAD